MQIQILEFDGVRYQLCLSAPKCVSVCTMNCSQMPAGVPRGSARPPLRRQQGSAGTKEVADARPTRLFLRHPESEVADFETHDLLPVAKIRVLHLLADCLQARWLKRVSKICRKRDQFGRPRGKADAPYDTPQRAPGPFPDLHESLLEL